MTQPLVTILILTWQNDAFLMRCLKALETQSFSDFEIVLIINAQHNPGGEISVSPPSRHHTLIKYINSNPGFAVANNIGARLAKGKWLVLLNADAFPEPDWLEKLVKKAEENPEYAFFSSHQIQADNPDRVDGAGDAYHISGLAWRNGYNHPLESYGHETKEIFSACAAAALISRDEFLQMGGFDEEYFSYFEDVDLGFRLRLAGKKCLYIPEAVVHHVGSASTGKRSDFSVYYGYRNMIWTFFKNMPSPLIWFLLPIHITTIIFFIFYLSLRGQGKVILRAVFDAIKGMPKVLEKRRKVQNSIKIKPSELLRVMSTGLLEPYTEFIHRNNPK